MSMDQGELQAFRFIGNQSVIERLEAKLAGGRLPHALIFTGPNGVGKHTCARWIAQALNCEAPTPMACLHCQACRRVADGSFPDVTTVTLEGSATQIKISQIRDIRSGLSLEPLEGKAMVWIIDPAESMTPSAANALLKSLEEPPSTAYFFLIATNALELLPTIRSRSQAYQFSPLSLAELQDAGVTDDLILRWAEGSVGRALTSEPAALRQSRDQMLHFLEHALHSDRHALADLIEASRELAQDKENYEEKIGMLGVLIRDVMFHQEGLEQRLINQDVAHRIEQLAEATERAHVLQVCETLKFIEMNLKFHLNRQLITDHLVLAMHPASGNTR